MIEILNISKSYGERTLFEDVSFIVNNGERVGVLGLNGSGKTTLFRILTGQEHIDNGNIKIPQGYKIGYLTQILSFKEKNILEEAISAIPKKDDGEDQDYLAKAMLQGLGFPQESFLKSPNMLSGGYQVRLQLIKLLLTNPDLLLLDEPSNYLDIVSLRWLTKFLRNWKNELLLISHDRNFVNDVVTHVIGIHRKKIIKVKGKIEDYERIIEEKETLYEKTRLNQEAKIAHMEDFIKKLGAKATKAKSAQSRVKALEKIDRLSELQQIKTLEFKFPEEPLLGKNAMTISNLSFGFAKNNLLIKDLNFIVSKKDRIGIIGKNGKGKTTLLRLLAGELLPITGSVTTAPLAKLGYFGQTNIERLDKKLTVEEEISSANPDSSRTKVRSICGLMMFSGDDATKKVEVLSGGEKSRVLLGKLLSNPTNVLLLDEPTNHLDMASTDALISASQKFNGAVLVVTHSEMILRKLVNRLIVFDDDKCFIFEGSYDDFLTRIGWKDEGIETKKEKQTLSTNNKKEARKARAEELKKANQILKPLKKEVEELEEKITTKEVKLKELEEKLITLYNDTYSEEVKNLEKEITFLKHDIDKLFSELEKASKKLDNAMKEI